MVAFTLEQMVEAVRAQRASRSLLMQPGATEQEIVSLIAETRETLAAELPLRYLNLLRITNGISENSLCVHPTHRVRNVSSDVYQREDVISGFVEQNLGLRADNEDLAGMLVFSTDDLYYHALHLDSGDYLLLPHEIAPPDKIFATFDELMIHAFKRKIKPQFWPS